MLNFNFAGRNFRGIGDGYRVACMMTPDGELMGDNFYVNLSIRRQLEEDDSVKLEHIRSRPSGDLELDGVGGDATGIKHRFKNIRLLSVLFEGNHRSKSRVLEFQYNRATLLSGADDDVDLKNEWDSTCESPRLGHRLTVGDREDALLGLAYRQTAAGNTLLRLQWYANSGKSIFGEVFARRGGWKRSLNLTLGDNTIEVTQNNLARVIVEQTWGRFSNETQPSYDALLSLESVRLPRRPMSGGDVLRAERGDDERTDLRAVDGGIVETATFVFQDGAFQDLELV